MIEVGKMQKLQVNSKTAIGAYLAGDILLPKNELPPEIEIGDQVEVFVYTDAAGKAVATVNKPKLTMGEVGPLKVVETTKFGVFLDWGLPKDLLLPLKEQVGKVKKGNWCLVGLYINHHHKICATMRIYDLLSTESPYKKNSRAHGTIYNINKEYGVFVAVDNKYHGLIPNNELYGNFAIGDNIEVRVKRVREDGKLELSLRDEAYKEIEADARKLMERLKLNGGKLPINDNSSPDYIKAELNISKRAFKRAAGRLLKEGAIKITEEGIEMMW